MEGVPHEQANAIERVFMGMVDSGAKAALDKIASGDGSPWTSHMRSAWTRFILSLIFRNPEAVAIIKAQLFAIWEAAFASLRSNYQGWRRPTDPATLDEYMALIDPADRYKAPFVFLQEMIDNDRFGNTVFNMTWHRISLHESALPLLISDRPLERHLGWDSPEAYIALPIAPKMLFVAAHDGRWAERIRSANQTQTVAHLNRATIRRARKFVWGIDDNYLNRVQELMSLDPDQMLITDDQRQKAIDVAAGK